MSEQVFVSIVTTAVLAALGFGLMWVHGAYGLTTFVIVGAITFALLMAAAFRLEAIDQRARRLRQGRSDPPEAR